jgi:F-type H+-transporting ATPase subunit a
MNTAGISSDEVILWQWGVLVLNATIVYTWLVMAILTLGAWLITRKLSSDEKLSRWQNLLEVIVAGIARQIREITSQDPARFLPFIGSMFLFIAASNLLAFLPGYYPPTGSLSTTAALALCVLVAVPVYGFAAHGFIGYLKRYIQPTPFMLPFHVMGELSRTLALAVRLSKSSPSFSPSCPSFFPSSCKSLDYSPGSFTLTSSPSSRWSTSPRPPECRKT